MGKHTFGKYKFRRIYIKEKYKYGKIYIKNINMGKYTFKN